MAAITKTFRIDDALVQRLEELAVEDNRTLNNLVNTVLMVYEKNKFPLVPGMKLPDPVALVTALLKAAGNVPFVVNRDEIKRIAKEHGVAVDRVDPEMPRP